MSLFFYLFQEKSSEQEHILNSSRKMCFVLAWFGFQFVIPTWLIPTCSVHVQTHILKMSSCSVYVRFFTNCSIEQIMCSCSWTDYVFKCRPLVSSTWLQLKKQYKRQELSPHQLTPRPHAETSRNLNLLTLLNDLGFIFF